MVPSHKVPLLAGSSQNQDSLSVSPGEIETHLETEVSLASSVCIVCRYIFDKLCNICLFFGILYEHSCHMLRDIRHIFIYGYPEPKEIGIYKVLGASTGSILKLLMKVLLVQ